MVDLELIGTERSGDSARAASSSRLSPPGSPASTSPLAARPVPPAALAGVLADTLPPAVAERKYAVGGGATSTSSAAASTAANEPAVDDKALSGSSPDSLASPLPVPPALTDAAADGPRAGSESAQQCATPRSRRASAVAPAHAHPPLS